MWRGKNNFHKLYQKIKKKITHLWIVFNINFHFFEEKHKKFYQFYEKRINYSSMKFITVMIAILVSLFLLTFKAHLDLKKNLVKNNIPITSENTKYLIEGPINQDKVKKYQILKYKIKTGDTLLNILTKQLDLELLEAYKVINELTKHFAISSLKINQELDFKYKTEIYKSPNIGLEYKNVLDELRIVNLDSNSEIIIARTDDNNFVGKQAQIKLHEQYLKYNITVKNSLYIDGIDAGIPPAIMVNLINYLSFDFDFQRDIQKNDTLEIVFSTFYSDQGQLIKSGDILFASINSRSNNVSIYKFLSKKYGNMYFNRDGVSSKKSLLKTPINGARISSGFNLKRKHPILGYTRAHRGVDFAAPMGTPIFAAGNGVVVAVKRGFTGGYGNYIKIKHNDTYQTAYAHISKFAKNIQVGKRVQQGEIIAYVGSTGRATGPHLHYEVLYKGQQINPSSMKAIPNIKLNKQELIEFNKQVKKIDEYRQILPQENDLNNI